MSRSGAGELHPDELISASLTGDLTDVEQAQLERHLAGCSACQATLTAFREERRLVSGLHHLPPPADLEARIAAGIAAGDVPWWQRPRVLAGAVAGLAVAAAVLALAVFSLDSDPQVGVSATTTPSTSPSATATVEGAFPTLPPGATPTATPAGTPTATPAATPTATPTAAPTATQTPAPSTPAPTPAVAQAAAPDAYLQFTAAEPPQPDELVVVEGESGETVAELEPPGGPPINAVLSPDGGWLAYITEVGQKGTNQVWVTRLSDGELLPLGETLAGSPFLEQMSWSPDSRYLAYTVADETGTNAWLFDAEDGSNDPMTVGATAFAASFQRGPGDETRLWLSVAGREPVSYLIDVPEDEVPVLSLETLNAIRIAEGVFQPLFNAAGTHAIYWRGTMEGAGEEAPIQWLMAEGGAPYLAEVAPDAEAETPFLDERPLFSDLAADSQAFSSAEVAWGADGNSFVVWNVAWIGEPQSAPSEPLYPDPLRVYFSNVEDDDLITRRHALDAEDVPEDAAEVTHVAVAADARHLSLTVRFPVGGELEPPRAVLLLVKRNVGTVADEVEQLAGDDGWIGPAVYQQADPEDAGAPDESRGPTATAAP